ncbi:MAG: S-methyl-5-thioribose-1-phosphate isomerase, partial [Rhodospirillaceae bacterium]|nr:S-methyl-5-thioribose-1-phosphate isomerase [Rhodospirillaceae bacterium]
AGGRLRQRGEVDLGIVGTGGTTAGGDVCNKSGTYLKALAARDNGVPFYVALPGPTIDWSLDDGRDIPIEERAADEVTTLRGVAEDGTVGAFRIVPEGSRAANHAFDLTPRRLVTALVTERGVCAANRGGLEGLYPEKADSG